MGFYRRNFFFNDRKTKQLEWRVSDEHAIIQLKIKRNIKKKGKVFF